MNEFLRSGMNFSAYSKRQNSMKTISPDSFAMIRFLVLMQNGDGLTDKSPDYVTEKTHILRAGLDAFAYLDIHNMEKTAAWCAKWGIELPKEVDAELTRQQEALSSFRLRPADSPRKITRSKSELVCQRISSTKSGKWK